MGVLRTFEHPGEAGEAGGVWFAASYPLGATRYYVSAVAREAAVSAYVAAIAATGGAVLVIPS